MSVAALATQQTINAGVMQKKNDMEWRVLEMQAAFEKAGLAVETPRRAGRPRDATKTRGNRGRRVVESHARAARANPRTRPEDEPRG